MIHKLLPLTMFPPLPALIMNETFIENLRL